MSLFGRVFGDSKDADPTAAPKALSEIAIRMINEAAPLKGQLMGRYNDFLSGDFDMTKLPAYGNLKDATERQFSLARNNLMSRMPAGGALNSGLANLEGMRATNMVSGLSSMYDNEMARAFALATGQTPVAMSALGSSANAMGQIGMAQAAQQGQAMQGLGYGLGSYLSNGSKAGSSAASGSAGSAAASSMYS